MTRIGRALSSPGARRQLWGAGAVPLGRLAEAATERHGKVPLWLDTPLAIAPHLGIETDYEAFAELVRDAAGWLHAAGVRPGDGVAIVKAHNVDVIALAGASARLGAVPALIAPEFPPDVLRILLRRLGDPLMVTDAATASRHHLAADYGSRVVSVDAETAGAIPLEDLRGGSEPSPRDPAPDDTVAVTHTSGTTGVPKLIRHTSQSLAGQAAIQVLGGRALLRRSDVIATCLTTAHARTLSGLPTIAAIGAPHLAMVRPDPASAGPLLARYRPTVVETFPNVFLRWEELAGDPSTPLANVRIFLSTFDAAHPRTIRTLLAASRRRLPLYAQAYAQSEVGAIAISFRTRRQAATGDARNVGWPALALVRLRIVDDRGRRVWRPGRLGHIHARSPGLFTGYVGEDERTANQWHRGFWDTGDLGARMRSGQLQLAGRVADALPGVANPLAVEDLLLDRLDEAIEVVLVAGPDGRATPVVATRGDLPLDPRRWDAAVTDLPTLAPPHQWRWDDLPKTATWKVRRLALAELLTQRADRHAGDGVMGAAPVVR